MKVIHDAALVVRKQLNYEVNLELSTEVDRRRKYSDGTTRNKLHESNELSLYERSEEKQKHDSYLVVIK